MSELEQMREILEGLEEAVEPMAQTMAGTTRREAIPLPLARVLAAQALKTAKAALRAGDQAALEWLGSEEAENVVPEDMAEVAVAHMAVCYTWFLKVAAGAIRRRMQ